MACPELKPKMVQSKLPAAGAAAALEHRPHLLALSLPLVGCMTPMVQLCKILIAKAGCRVTIACNERAVGSLLRLLPEKHEEHHMQVLPISDGLPLDMGPASWDTVRTLMIHAYQEGLARSLLPHLPSFSQVVCVLSDAFLSWTRDVAKQLGVPRIVFSPAGVAESQVHFYADELIEAGKLPFKAPLGKDDKAIDNMIPMLTSGTPPAYHRLDAICEGEEEFKIPGLPTLNRRDFPTFLQIEDSSDELFYGLLEQVKSGADASILLFNSFDALEGRALDAMRSQGIPAHAIGPLLLLEDVILNEQVEATQQGKNAEGKNLLQGGEQYPECLRWLDGQKPKSVMYVAFGSLIYLTADEVRELAWGLLSSGQPFIWVYPSPRVQGRELPEGFSDQVKDQGLLLEWAPQTRILKHPSTGGFLSHCGWNSTTETICGGVPMLAFPHVDDHYLNCKMVVDEWKMGLRLERSPKKGIALAPDIARLTRELLVGAKGAELRRRAEELKVAAEISVQPGGCSHRTLDAVIKLVLNK